jgi:uncharacterized membrane protein YdjX (TVP38/TMEM64 family)
VLLVAGAAAVWRWTPLSALVDVDALAGLASGLAEAPLAPVWVLGAYLLASVLAVPIALLVVATALVFGAAPAFIYAVAGSLAGAAAGFGIGHVLGRDAVGRLGGDRLNRLNRRLGRRGLLAVITLRVLPLAPFTLVNLAAGASHIRLRDFLLGTLLGMLPGIAAITAFSDRLLAALRDPSLATLAGLGVAALALAAVALALRRWLRRRAAAQDGAGTTADPAP